MRTLNRNKRTIFYATLAGTEPIMDEYGNNTLEVRTLYNEPVEIRANISASFGEEDVAVFGSASNYSRTICITDKNCPIDEQTLVWFGITPDDGPHNYEVVEIADSINGLLIAVREVITSD